MKALLYKDYTVMKKSYLHLIGLVLVIALLFQKNNMAVALLATPSVFLLLGVIISSISIGYELQNNFINFIFASPLTRKQLVQSKMVLGGVFSLLGLAVVILQKLIHHIPYEITLFSGALALALPMLFIAVQLPFFYRYGVERGRLIMVVTYMVIFGVMNYLKSVFEGKSFAVFTEMVSKPVEWIAGGIILVALIIVLICYRATLKILMKKEY